MKLDWRARIAIAGSLGLLGNAGVMLLIALWHNAQEAPAWLSTALTRINPTLQSSEQIVILIVYVVLMGLALAEIPLMTIGLRAMVNSRSRSMRIILGATAIFVFFAAVYAAAFVLLARRLDLGLTIAGTGILRLMAVALGVIGFRTSERTQVR